MNFLTVIEGIPYKTIGISALKSYYNKQKEKVRWVIEKELRQGDFSRVDKDDIIAIYFRLCHEAIEGTAKNNLRLMARLICGLNAKNRLTASTFQKYSKILADLSEEEIVILSAIIKNYNEHEETLLANSIDRALVYLCGEPDNCDKEKFKICIETMNALERTGLLISKSGGFDTSSTGSAYHSPFSITELMKQLISFFPNWEDIAKWEKEND